MEFLTVDNVLANLVIIWLMENVNKVKVEKFITQLRKNVSQFARLTNFGKLTDASVLKDTTEFQTLVRNVAVIKFTSQVFKPVEINVLMAKFGLPINANATLEATTLTTAAIFALSIQSMTQKQNNAKKYVNKNTNNLLMENAFVFEALKEIQLENVCPRNALTIVIIIQFQIHVSVMLDIS